MKRGERDDSKVRFRALLQKQEWDRNGLGEKLRLEKHAMLEAKAQDLARLKLRLRNAEQELKKQHVRQALQAENKLNNRTSSLSYSVNSAPSRTGTRRLSARGSTSGGNKFNRSSKTRAVARGGSFSARSTPSSRGGRFSSTRKKNAKELVARRPPNRTQAIYKNDVVSRGSAGSGRSKDFLTDRSSTRGTMHL